MTRLSFSSDNHAGVHPAVLEALGEANHGAASAYGDDPWTARATARIRDLVQADAEVFFVYGGTGANVLGLQAMTRPHHAIICTESAHIAVDECGAPERFTGCKLLTVPTPEGKLTPDMLRQVARTELSQHWSLPRVVSVSQQTECGTLYSPTELRALADSAHDHGWLLHLDGARLSNAAAALDCSLVALTREAGVDVFSFGGTKNGLLFGEAVVFLRTELAREFAHVRKQGMQLASKMRFISAQFEALLLDDLWKRNAGHANAMAARLEAGIAGCASVQLKWPRQGNALFARLAPEAVAALQREFVFEVWIPEESVVRWMTSWSTTPDEVDRFVAAIRSVCGKGSRQASPVGYLDDSKARADEL